jgi:hypothetical protein
MFTRHLPSPPRATTARLRAFKMRGPNFHSVSVLVPREAEKLPSAFFLACSFAAPKNLLFTALEADGDLQEFVPSR